MSEWQVAFGSKQANTPDGGVSTPLERLAYRWAMLGGQAGLNAMRAERLAELNTLLPTLTDAHRAFTGWLELVRGLKKSDGVGEEATDEARSRMRARTPPLRMFQGWGEGLARPFSVYWLTLPPNVRREMHKVFSVSGLLRVSEASDVFNALKELGGIAKKYQEMLFGEDWMKWVDMNVANDYMPEKEISQFEEDIRDWVTGEVSHEIEGSEALFLQRFREGVRKFYELSPFTEGLYFLTLDEFCSDPGYWAVAGTSDGPRLWLDERGRLRKARKSKWASALAMSSADVKKLILKWERQNNKAIQKRERGKVRAVIAGDLGLYLRMSYVSHALEQIMRKHQHTTLFMSTADQLRLWIRMGKSSSRQDEVLMPIDQAAFDHMVTRRMLRIVDEEQLAFLRRRVLNAAVIADIEKVYARIRYSLDGGFVSVGKKRFPYEKGVLSGWRWTALYDTVVNAGELLAFAETIKSHTGVFPLLDWVCQGDDVRTALHSYGEAVALWSLFDRGGFIVNPTKFFIKQNADEFLRQVAWRGRVGGYPARAVGALVWRNPISREALKGELRVRETYKSWETFFSRMGNRNDRLMIADVTGSSGISAEQLLELERTPAAVGGLGVDICYTGEWAKMGPGVADSDWHWHELPRVAKELGAAWHVPPAEIAHTWKGNIEPSGTQKYIVVPGKVERVEKLVPILGAQMPMAPATAPMFPRPEPGVPPSVVETVRENEPLQDWWMDTESRMWADRVRRTASRRVYIDWVQGKLPFKAPIVRQVSDLTVSQVHSGRAGNWWAWALGRSKLNYRVVERAAISAEIDTHRVCAARTVTEGIEVTG